MSNSTGRVIPSLAIFLEDGVESVSPGSENCGICFDSFDKNVDGVSVNPCKHFFHRSCIIEWFRTQLFHESLARNHAHNYGTCPFDRRKLFSVIELDTRHIEALLWTQSLYELKDTPLEAISQEALRRIHAQPKDTLSLDLVDELVRDMVRADPEYEITAIALGVLVHWRLSRQHGPGPALQQHEVDVATAGLRYINETLRGDIFSLHITTAVHTPDSVLHSSEGVDWESIIEAICADWQHSRYPRTNYITMPDLHRLSICVLLVFRAHFVKYDNTAQYMQLLAHGERLLLEAQERVASGTLSESELEQHYRLLDAHLDGTNLVPLRSERPYYHQNHDRMMWFFGSGS